MGSQVYQLPYEDCREFYPDGTVNAEGKHRRTTMKSVLLGIMYERGATAIGEQFNKSAEWAQQLIDNFYKSFPKINQYRLKIENMAETYGYVTTITGRKRRLPDMQLEDKDDYRYQEANRQSLNSVIPVSYTHLDVYKRQDSSNAVHDDLQLLNSVIKILTVFFCELLTELYSYRALLPDFFNQLFELLTTCHEL